MDTGPSGFGWSFYGTFRVCPRKFALKYRFPGYCPVEIKPAPALGSLLHAILAHYYAARTGQPQPPLADVVRRTAQERGVPPENVQLAIELATHYVQEFGGRGWAVLFVERLLACTFTLQPDGRVVTAACDPAQLPPWPTAIAPGVPVPYTARADLGVREGPTAAWIVDHKTASHVVESTFWRYASSGQFAGLQILGGLHVPGFVGTKITGVQTGGAGAKRNANAARKVVTRPTPAAPGLVEDFPLLVVTTAAQIAWLDSWAGRNPRLWPATASDFVCGSYGGCDYASYCRRGGVI